MRYKQLGNSDLMVSAVGLGTWAMGGDKWGAVEDETSIRAIRAAIEAGVRLIDTAPAYGGGHAEQVVGKAIKGYRDQVILATKLGVPWNGQRYANNLKADSIRKEVEQSLRDLDVDYIDLYQIHYPDPNTPVEETARVLEDLQKEGKFRYLGVSNFSIQQIQALDALIPITSVQSQFSLLERKNAEILQYCQEKGMGTLTYGSLGAGVLSGKYTACPAFSADDTRGNFYPFFREPMWSKCAQLVEVLREIARERQVPVSHVAINWVNQNPVVSTALVGVKTAAQAVENAAAGNWMLSDEETERINQNYRRIFL